MEIIKRNVASIKHNDPDVEERVFLSIALEWIDGEARYFIITDLDEDAGPRFVTFTEAESAIYDMWGKSPEWDLQYN